MASILDKYGIKEVADVTFYAIDESTGAPTNPVLFLDTLKVSTIEQTAENTSARGGKANPELIIWDYNKEITLTLEDALFSAKSMAVMFGATNDTSVASGTIKKTMAFTGTAYPTYWTDPQGGTHAIASATYYDEKGEVVASTASLVAGKKYFATFDIAVDEAKIEISYNTFPGNYYITGDTYARNDVSGKDEFFQFIIPKAKMLSEVTLTMEAEGDPSTFSMNMKVLRPGNNQPMMKLVKYNLPN